MRSNAYVPMLALLLLGPVAGLLADQLWFAAQGQAGTFWTFVRTRLLLRFGLGAIYAAVFFVNLRVAGRSASRTSSSTRRSSRSTWT